MSFTHYISTRFNVPTDVWNLTRDGKRPLSDEWMSERFEIFNKYCLPSFRNQTNQNFIWLVFFDVNTDRRYITEINEIQRQYPNFRPVYVEDFCSMHRRFRQIIGENCKKKYVITTDIDNDDILHKDFIDRVQRLFQKKHDLVIGLKLGLQLTRTRNHSAFGNIFHMTANPFVSLVELCTKAETVMKEEHPQNRNYKNYISEENRPMFIQFIHQNNLMNSSLSAKRVFNVNWEEFAIDKGSFTISRIEALKHNALRKINILKKMLLK